MPEPDKPDADALRAAVEARELARCGHPDGAVELLARATAGLEAIEQPTGTALAALAATGGAFAAIDLFALTPRGLASLRALVWHDARRHPPTAHAA